MHLTLARQEIEETVSRKGIHFPGTALCLGWACSSRCVGARLALLYLSSFVTQQAARHVDRAVQNVGVKLRKAKTTRRTIERTYAFDR
jgi:hypothetical protein